MKPAIKILGVYALIQLLLIILYLFVIEFEQNPDRFLPVFVIATIGICLVFSELYFRDCWRRVRGWKPGTLSPSILKGEATNEKSNRDQPGLNNYERKKA